MHKVALNNHIRNILAIMVDLIDIDLINVNKGLGCIEQKDTAKKINQEFWEKFSEFVDIFLETSKSLEMLYVI